MRKIMFVSTALALATGFASNATAAASKPRVAPQITAIGKVAMPERKTGSRGSVSPYPFDSMEVETAFGVKNKDARGMSSIISNQNRKHRTPVKDEAGNIQYETKAASDGQGGTIQVPDTNKPKLVQTKEFAAFDVDAAKAKELKGTPLEGSTVLVFRTK